MLLAEEVKLLFSLSVFLPTDPIRLVTFISYQCNRSVPEDSKTFSFDDDEICPKDSVMVNKRVKRMLYRACLYSRSNGKRVVKTF